VTERTPTPHLACIQLHPIKSLDPFYAPAAQIGPNGGLEFDRAWALYALDGKWINGKRTPAIHFIRAAFNENLSSLTLVSEHPDRPLSPATFAFPNAHDAAAAWFREYFQEPVMVRYAREGFPDDGLASGPTIVSTATLESVCEWFPGISLDGARRRFRTTLEIDGVPAFWEDQLFAPSDRQAVRFRIGDVAFEGSNPCARCPVPSRDAHSAAVTPMFQKRFSDLRREQLPSWSPAERFDHFYRLAVNTRVPGLEAGKSLRLGDPLLLP
jgi:uncharacterized protein YcbX